MKYKKANKVIGRKTHNKRRKSIDEHTILTNKMAQMQTMTKLAVLIVLYWMSKINHWTIVIDLRIRGYYMSNLCLVIWCNWHLQTTHRCIIYVFRLMTSIKIVNRQIVDSWYLRWCFLIWLHTPSLSLCVIIYTLIAFGTL